MLMNSISERDKAAISLLAPALHPVSLNGAPVPLDLALTLVVVVVLALLIPDLMVASSSILPSATIAKIPMLIVMLDSPLFNPLVELLAPSASKVLSVLQAVPPKVLTASSIPAVVLEPVLNLPLSSAAARLLFVPRLLR
jgi:hypothetical protein